MPQASGDTSLSRRFLIAILTPVALLFIVGGLLTIQIVRMTDTARWVDHTDGVISRIHDLQRQIIDQETGVRGYLLTGDRVFLEPYERAHPLDLFAELSPLVADNPAQQARVLETRERYLMWLSATKDLTVPGARLDDYRHPEFLRERKARMDSVREGISDMLATETALRTDRTKAAETTNRTSFWGGGFLLGGLAIALAFVSRRELGAVSEIYDGLLKSERDTREKVEAEAWLRARQMALAERVRGDRAIKEIGDAAIRELAENVGAVVGAFYTASGDGWARAAGYALDPSSPERFADGEGLVGQVARNKKLMRVKDAPADLLRVRSGTAERAAVEVVLIPAAVEGETQAIVELGFLKSVEPRVLELLERVGETLGVAVRSAAYRGRLRDLLEESQRQGEELQVQQEELRVANEELVEQSDALRAAQAQLEERKEELEASNADLESQRDALQRVQRELADKAQSLTRASQYKSEFLANMSHELRTPLNSTLILAKLLADNKDDNLTAEQVKFAKTIYSAGNDLLLLINDILDLSKIEAGKVDIHTERVAIKDLLEPVTRTFEPIAQQKGLAFQILADDPSEVVETDSHRVQQILKNLLSNAFKFTEKGSVELRIGGADGQLTMAVRDTGIGIAPQQQEAVFEAFRQADATTNRKFGGTGLGLSISRELAKHLGGDLRLESTPGVGSTFTLTLPKVADKAAVARRPEPRPEPRAAARTTAAPSAAPSPKHEIAAARPATPADDRERLDKQRSVLLIIEDDVPFTDILATLGRKLDFQILIAHSANDGVRLALEHAPSAIVLDMKLPDHSGLSVLDRLKQNMATRHIPIHVVSAEDHTREALSMGAAGYLMKPVNHDDLVAVLKELRGRFSRMRRLLVVEDDKVQREAIKSLLQTEDVEIVSVDTVAAALEQLSSSTFDCVVTDLALPDASGFEMLEKMAHDERHSFPPVIVYTGRQLSPEDEHRLRRYSSSIIVKGVRSPERLLDEVSLFLHQVESQFPADRQRMLRQARDRETVFAGRKILVAEDDVRNIFALTSILEPKGANLIFARNGLEALSMLDANPDVDLVLMDIMMPEMDGLAATKAIRQRGGKLARLPIIALTAKAMRDDQERCLAAGCNDYLAKPLDVEMLLSLIRVWMPK